MSLNATVQTIVFILKLLSFLVSFGDTVSAYIVYILMNTIFLNPLLLYVRYKDVWINVTVSNIQSFNC